MSRRLDSIYTPSEIAVRIAAAMPADVAGWVVDPAAGEGALLDAIVARFGERARPLALDIDGAAVAQLAAKGWIVSRADALNSNARRATKVWRQARQSLAAVVINPPFSYRGNGGTVVQYGNFVGRVAPAIEFLAASLTDLRPEFGFWAILPEGALLADKHQGFWGEVKLNHQLRVIARLPQNAFPGARVSTILIELRPGASPESKRLTSPPAAKVVTQNCVCVEVIRGRVPVYRSSLVADALPEGAAPFVHTTDVGTRPIQSKRRYASDVLADTGPMVLISRVGRWNLPALVHVGRVVLSDCLIAIRPLDRASFSFLAESLRDYGPEIAATFKGTGAKYLTLTNLTNALEQLGWRPIVVKASQDPGRCSCGAEPALADYGT
ncbi:MAG TPA: hypothetical protein VGM70_01970 [Pseudolysinimonas sp.]|jgi:hypothetical protein